jgi:hypothetical protein
MVLYAHPVILHAANRILANTGANMGEDKRNIVLLFPGEGMGTTEGQDLREKLASTFLGLIAGSGELPRVICFYTDGVKLACEGSPVLDVLGELEKQGVELVVCTTCLNHFGIMDQMRVGVAGSMPDIITAMWRADSVITL